MESVTTANNLIMLNWMMGGLLAMNGYIFKLIFKSISELRKEKLSKDQFKEFKEANHNQHETMVATQANHDTKLDQILFNQNKGSK